MGQIEGEALAVPFEELSRLLRPLCELGPLLTHYSGLLVTFVSRSAVCSRYHDIRQRAVRWLLIIRDRAASDQFRMTHEWFAHMLGSGRTALTKLLGTLRDEGLIELTRGSIRILDRPGLEASVCECHAEVERAFDELVRSPSGRCESEGGYQPGEHGTLVPGPEQDAAG